MNIDVCDDICIDILLEFDFWEDFSNNIVIDGEY